MTPGSRSGKTSVRPLVHLRPPTVHLSVRPHTQPAAPSLTRLPSHAADLGLSVWLRGRGVSVCADSGGGGHSVQDKILSV